MANDTSKREVGDENHAGHTHVGMIRIGVDCEFCDRMLEKNWNLKIPDSEFE